MALNGINLPLAFTGQEALWQEVHSKCVTGVPDIYENLFMIHVSYLDFVKIIDHLAVSLL